MGNGRAARQEVLLPTGGRRVFWCQQREEALLPTGGRGVVANRAKRSCCQQGEQALLSTRRRDVVANKAERRCCQQGEEGVVANSAEYSLVDRLSHYLTIDHASLSRRSERGGGEKWRRHAVRAGRAQLETHGGGFFTHQPLDCTYAQGVPSERQ